MNSDSEKIVQRIEETLLTYCRQQGLFKSGDRVIAACSGGADSMALLLFLLRRRRDLEIEVLATHVNHGIRGMAALADANFVTAFCRQNGVELFLYDSVREGVEIPQNPSEEWARGLRYGWFDQLAVQEEAFIATAHTMSDQMETVLFRMARGTGLHGLAGIPPRRGYYVRPCLCLTRADTEAYCAALGQNYVQDETNAENLYARNRIRHDAVPALQYANPAAETAVARLCRQMRELDDWLSGEAAALLQTATVSNGYEVSILRRAEGPVLDAALHALVSPVRDAEEKYISLLRFLLQRGEGALQLAPEVTYKVKDGVLLRLTPQGIRPPPAPPPAVELRSACRSAGAARRLGPGHRQRQCRGGAGAPGGAAAGIPRPDRPGPLTAHNFRPFGAPARVAGALFFCPKTGVDFWAEKGMETLSFSFFFCYNVGKSRAAPFRGRTNYQKQEGIAL